MSQIELFRAMSLPVFQNKMFETRAEAIASATGDMRLVQDQKSGLIFNAVYDSTALVYDASYQNEQAHSSAFQRHIDKVAEIISRHFEGATIIEIGCGKGYFLQRLADRGLRVTGFDPAYEGDAPNIIKASFEAGYEVAAEGIVLRHVLEHIANPVEFLVDIARANNGKGLIYVEVPCFDWICEHRAWFDVFYEHVNYFRLVDFQRIFGRVRESGRLFGGQYLYVVAELSSLRVPTATPQDRVAFPRNFLAGKEALVADMRGRQRGPVIWGGGAKGVMFALYVQRQGIPVDLLIDINPAKQDKFVPLTGLQVCSPEHALKELPAGSPVYVMNSNYLNEIIEQSGNQYTYLTVE